MATETVTVRMSRSDSSTPWGFRLQGGREFNSALQIGKVTGGSLADRAGLLEGDYVLQVAGRAAENMQHKDAQNAIMTCGNNVDLIVQRSGNRIWKPSVTPLDLPPPLSNSYMTPPSSAPAPTTPTMAPPPPVKYSLEHNQQQETRGIGSGHNVTPKPFGSAGSARVAPAGSGGGGGGGPSVAHLQYNSPANLYSSGAAVEAYLQQTGGLFGTDPNLINKKEPSFLKSETLRLIQESEKSAHQPAWAEGRDQTLHSSHAETQSGSFNRLTHALDHGAQRIGTTVVTPKSGSPGIIQNGAKPKIAPQLNEITNAQAKLNGAWRAPPTTSTEKKVVVLPPIGAAAGHRTPPKNGGGVAVLKPIPKPKPPSSSPPTRGPTHVDTPRGAPQSAPSGTPVCDNCGRNILGVFCKAGGKTLHAECFNCTTCGNSLKNTGYFLVDEKLYCEVHAKQRQNFKLGAAPPVDPSAFLTRVRPPSPSRRETTPPKAFYQPHIMEPTKDYSWHEHQHVVAPVPASARGIPSAPHTHGSGGGGGGSGGFSSSSTYQHNSSSHMTNSYATSGAPPPPPASTVVGGRVWPPPGQQRAVPFWHVRAQQSDVFGAAVHDADDDVRDKIIKYKLSRLRQAGSSSPISLGTLIRSNEQTSPKTVPVRTTSLDHTEQVLTVDQQQSNASTNDAPFEMISPRDEKFHHEVHLGKKTVLRSVEQWREAKLADGSDTADVLAKQEIIETEAPLPVTTVIEKLHSPKRHDEPAIRPPWTSSATPVTPPSTPHENHLSSSCKTAANLYSIGLPLEARVKLADTTAQCETSTNFSASTAYSVTDQQPVTCVTDTQTVAIVEPTQDTNSSATQFHVSTEGSAFRKVPAHHLSEAQELLDSTVDLLSTELDRLERCKQGDAAVATKPKKAHPIELLPDSGVLGTTPSGEVSPLKPIAPPLPSPGDSGPPITFTRPPWRVAASTSATSTTAAQHVEVVQSKHERSQLATSTELTIIYKETPDSENNTVYSSTGAVDSREGGAPFTTSGFSSSTDTSSNRVARRGRGILKTLQEGPRIPVCESCRHEIRGPYVVALSKTWCPDHFVCGNPQCHRKLLDVGFIEENGQIYCEYCYEQYFAPACGKCGRPVIGDCLNALNRQWHPDCFTCSQCHKPFGNSSFFLEDGKPYCENDWNQLFTTKCVNCQFPIEAGDRWVEALGNAYHSDCFTCGMCHKNLEGQSFYAKGGKPYCKAHA